MELEKQIEEVGRGFEEFKKAHNKELTELKEMGRVSKETAEKVEKVNEELTKMTEQLDSMKAAMNRKPKGVEEKKAELEEVKAKHQEAINRFMKTGKGLEDVREMEQKAFSVQSDEDGGFFVSPERSNEIIKKMFESSPVRQEASVLSISSDSLKMIIDDDETASGWVGEEESRAETDTPTIALARFDVNELYARPKATQKFLDDAEVNVEAWLAEKVSSKFARDEATAFISGSGVNSPKGILSYTDGTGMQQVERQNTASSGSLAADDLIDLTGLLKEAYHPNAKWMINRNIIKAIRKLKGSDNNYLWQPGLAAMEPNQLLGKPVLMAQDLASAVSGGNEIAIFGDFRQGYQIVDRVGIRVLRDPYSTKGFVEFYTTKRVGGGVKAGEALKVLKVTA